MTYDLLTYCNGSALELTKRYTLRLYRNTQGLGLSVIGKLKETKVKRNLYYEIKDKVVEETTINGRVVRSNRKTKVYGLDSSHHVRENLIELLKERVNLHKDKFISPTLHKELTGLEIKRNGKVEHSDLTHDDQIFSYLMALYVWYEGKNLRELYGIEKSAIQTEESIDDIVELETANGKTDSDMLKPMAAVNRDTNETETNRLENQLLGMEKAKGMVFSDFVKHVRKQEDEHLRNMLRNPVAKEAYARHYGVAPDMVDTNIGQDGYTENEMSLPTSLFLDFNKSGEEMDDMSIYREVQYMNEEEQRRKNRNAVFEDDSVH